MYKTQFNEHKKHFFFLLANILILGSFLYLILGPAILFEYVFVLGIELCFSLDNLLIFFAILSYFNIPVRFYNSVLCLGIFLGIVLRAFIIKISFYVIPFFKFFLLPFGLILINTSFSLSSGFYKTMENKNTFNQESIFPIKIILALLAIEIMDLVCALDSIPVVFLITKNSFIIFFSSVFSILLLRSIFLNFYNIFFRYLYLKIFVSNLLFYLGIKIVFIFFDFSFSNELFFIFTPIFFALKKK